MFKNKTSYVMPDFLESTEDKLSDFCGVTKEAS